MLQGVSHTEGRGKLVISCKRCEFYPRGGINVGKYLCHGTTTPTSTTSTRYEYYEYGCYIYQVLVVSDIYDKDGQARLLDYYF